MVRHEDRLSLSHSGTALNHQKNVFESKTKEMNGNIFQLHVEQKQKGQFQDTLDQLQVYSSAIY